MKITVEHYDETYTVECPDTIENYVDAIRGLAHLMGYHQNTIDEYVPHWEEETLGGSYDFSVLDKPFGEHSVDIFKQCGFDIEETGRSYGI